MTRYSKVDGTLKPGQQIFGRKSIASDLKVNESKVQRILKTFESEQQIEQQTSSKNRLVSIVNWSRYQDSEQLIEQQLNNKRTTTEQQVNTNNNTNNTNNSKKRVTRHKHGQYSHILLTDEQYDRLKSEYPAIDETIKKMDEWIQLKGKPYKDYNLALRKWLKDEPEDQAYRHIELPGGLMDNFHNTEAEITLIGTILKKNDVIAEAGTILNPDDFFVRANELIFAEMVEMYQKKIGIDMLTVASHMAPDTLRAIGGISYLSQASETPASLLTYREHITEIKRKSKNRKMLTALNDGVEMIMESESETVIEMLQTKIVEAQAEGHVGTASAPDIALDIIKANPSRRL